MASGQREMLAIVSIVGFAIVAITGVLVGIGKVDATAFTTLAGTLLGGVVGLMKSSNSGEAPPPGS